MLQEMIIAAVKLFSEHMRTCLLSGSSTKSLPTDALRVRLVANLRHLREAYDELIKLDLPSQVVNKSLSVYHTLKKNESVKGNRFVKKRKDNSCLNECIKAIIY